MLVKGAPDSMAGIFAADTSIFLGAICVIEFEFYWSLPQRIEVVISIYLGDGLTPWYPHIVGQLNSPGTEDEINP